MKTISAKFGTKEDMLDFLNIVLDKFPDMMLNVEYSDKLDTSKKFKNILKGCDTSPIRIGEIERPIPAEKILKDIISNVTVNPKKTNNCYYTSKSDTIFDDLKNLNLRYVDLEDFANTNKKALLNMKTQRDRIKFLFKKLHVGDSLSTEQAIRVLKVSHNHFYFIRTLLAGNDVISSCNLFGDIFVITSEYKEDTHLDEKKFYKYRTNDLNMKYKYYFKMLVGSINSVLDNNCKAFDSDMLAGYFYSRLKDSKIRDKVLYNTVLKNFIAGLKYMLSEKLITRKNKNFKHLTVTKKFYATYRK